MQAQQPQQQQQNGSAKIRAVMALPPTRMTPRPKPGSKPACCGGGAHRVCPNAVRWRIDQGYYCVKHAEMFWESHFVDEHRVLRLMRDDKEIQSAPESINFPALPTERCAI